MNLLRTTSTEAGVTGETFTCDGCGFSSTDAEWMHVFDHPLKHLTNPKASWQDPVTCCGFCYESVMGGRIAQYPDQLLTDDDAVQLYQDFTLQNNRLRELIKGLSR